ncbi:hypothetical protein [Streptomyces sp. NRRL S-350]|uniref:hypothetical protein n=1 Tax=Streptomyces sp. NRRL S-350 TaxID=1463902 RepID=UPI0004C1C0F0|nr:hypothetical protein [Streptomyces sp. NRRL S-350]
MREELPLDVAAARVAVTRAEAIAADAEVSWPPDEQTLSLLSGLAEELLGHLLLLTASVEADYRLLPSAARLRPVIDGAARLAGALLAWPGTDSYADVQVLTAVCRLLLTLHQVHPLVPGTRPRPADNDVEPDSPAWSPGAAIYWPHRT